MIRKHLLIRNQLALLKKFRPTRGLLTVYIPNNIQWYYTRRNIIREAMSLSIMNDSLSAGVRKLRTLKIKNYGVVMFAGPDMKTGKPMCIIADLLFPIRKVMYQYGPKFVTGIAEVQYKNSNISVGPEQRIMKARRLKVIYDRNNK